MKDLYFGIQSKQKMVTGVQKLAKAVKSTLGPGGQVVLLDRMDGQTPVLTKDGVSVAQEVFLEDRAENAGAQIVKNVAKKTNEVAGDGTTTATVLAESIVTTGMKLITSGASPVNIKKGIEIATQAVVETLDNATTDVSDGMLIEIATISANGDAEVGKLIAEAISKVGPKGPVRVEPSGTVHTTLEMIDGFQYDRGFVHEHFSNNHDFTECAFENARILCYAGVIDNANDIIPLLKIHVASNQPLVLVADDIKGDALTVLAQNNANGKIRVLPVKTPGFGAGRLPMLEDLALITGATAIVPNSGIKLEAVTLDMLGQAETVVATEHSTLIYGSASKEVINDRAAVIEGQIEKSSGEMSAMHRIRLARLTTGISIINVGASTDVELKEKRDRIDDALNATRAAIEEGIVPGGGIALLRVGEQVKRDFDWSQYSESIDSVDVDIVAGIKILLNATTAPLMTICSNVSISGDVVMERVKENDNFNFGFDARNNDYVDMLEAGIIDPKKVTKTALLNASSIASLLLTTECSIILQDKTIDYIRSNSK